MVELSHSLKGMAPLFSQRPLSGGAAVCHDGSGAALAGATNSAMSSAGEGVPTPGPAAPVPQGGNAWRRLRAANNWLIPDAERGWDAELTSLCVQRRIIQIN